MSPFRCAGGSHSCALGVVAGLKEGSEFAEHSSQPPIGPDRQPHPTPSCEEAAARWQADHFRPGTMSLKGVRSGSEELLSSVPMSWVPWPVRLPSTEASWGPRPRPPGGCETEPAPAFASTAPRGAVQPGAGSRALRPLTPLLQHCPAVARLHHRLPDAREDVPHAVLLPGWSWTREPRAESPWSS